MHNSDKSIPIAAVCVLSSLSDAGLSCEQLLQVRRSMGRANWVLSLET